MKTRLARILLASDLHVLSVPVGTQKGQKGSWWQRFLEWFIFDTWKKWNMNVAIPRLKRKIFQLSKEAEFDLQVINGDAIESEYNERGMVKDVDHRCIRVINNTLSAVPVEKTFIAPGDHELGYRLPLSSDSQGGISCLSLECFEDVMGPLWQEYVFRGFHFLFLCSSLMIQKTEHLSLPDQQRINRLRDQQEKFILDKIREMPDNETAFVFLHDPDAISIFHRYISTFYQLHDKKIRIFCGHMHCEVALLPYKLLGKISHSCFAAILASKVRFWAKGNEARVALFEKYKLQIIPAPGGMLGIGGGFLVLNIFDDGSYEIERHKV